jgi:type I restriction enzyme, S subunit
VSLNLPVREIVEQSSDPLLAIADGWERVPLTEVADVINGFAFPSTAFNDKRGIPLIRIRDIFGKDTECFYQGPYDPRYLVEPGDLLVGMDGDFNCARWRGPQGLLNQRMCKVVLTTDLYEIGFLELALPGYLRAINENTPSSTVKHLSSKSVEEIPLPLPPLAEQRRIVAQVNALLATRASARQRLANTSHTLTRLRQATLAAACSGRLTAEWRSMEGDRETASDLFSWIQHSRLNRKAAARFGRSHTSTDLQVTAPDADAMSSTSLPSLPQEWAWAECGGLCRPERSLTYGVIKLGNSVESGVPTLRSSDVRYLRIEANRVKRIDPAIAAAYSRTFLEGGEILVTVRGSLGGVAVVPDDMRGFNVSREVAIVPIETALDADYVAYAIASPWSQDWLREVARGVTYTGVNIEDLKRLPLPVPPPAEQREIVRRVKQFFALVESADERVQVAAEKSERVPEAILAKAFRGELVPTEAELAVAEARDYESASALLERVRAQRLATNHRRRTSAGRQLRMPARSR